MLNRYTVIRVLLLYLFVGHAVAAVAWWWFMPGSFPVSHARFWLNAVFPGALLGLCLVGAASLLRRKNDVSRIGAAMLAIGTLSATVTACVIFPDLRRPVPALGAVLGLVELAIAVSSRGAPLRRSAFLMMAAAVPCGIFVPLVLRAEKSSTHPLNEPCPWEGESNSASAVGGSWEPLRVSSRVSVHPSPGRVAVQLDAMRLEIEPLLTFESTSRSGGWTISSVPGPERSLSFNRLTHQLTSTESDAAATLRLLGPRDRLSVSDDGAITLTAYAALAEPIYSHLNTFCVLTIDGHQSLELEFSPCGSTRFAPQPADYPVGHPARFAYCDAERDFRVVEATSGEKGPFVSLGEGRLEPGAPLTIGLVDRGRRVAQIRFDDWSSQFSTALSPTAGWEVAANAIEFQRLGPSPRSAVMIWITLAGTSVGRGWDTVGHAAGTYRNRLVVEVSD